MLSGMRLQEVCYCVHGGKWYLDVMCEMALLPTLRTLEKPESTFRRVVKTWIHKFLLSKKSYSGPITLFF